MELNNSNSTHHSRLPEALTLLSCSLSIIGASTIILSYVAWKEIRSPARRLLVFLSIADLLYATSNAVGLSVSVINGTLTETLFCEIQSAVSTFSALCSFFWTVFVAVYITISLVFSRPNLARNCFIPFHCIAWLLPAGLVIAAGVYGALGPTGNEYTFDWCWIYKNNPNSKMWMWLTGKAWEIGAYVVTLVLYTITECYVCIDMRWRHRRFVTPTSIALVHRMDKKFILVPVIFICLRMTGTVRFLLTSYADSHYANHSTLLQSLQGVGDCGQGFANAILFCLFNHRVRHRLFRLIFHCDKTGTGTEREKLVKAKEPPLPTDYYTKVDSDETDIGVSMKISSNSSSLQNSM